MKRMAFIIAAALVCLPAWAGTWREDFNGGNDFMWKGNPDTVAVVIKNGFLGGKSR